MCSFNHFWKLVQPNSRRIIQLQASHCDCSKQYILRQFNLLQVEKYPQGSSEIEYNMILAFIFFFVKEQKKSETLAAL